MSQLQSESPSLPEADMDSLLVKSQKPPRPPPTNASTLPSPQTGLCPEEEYHLNEGELYFTVQLPVKLWVLASHMPLPAALIRPQERTLLHNTKTVLQIASGEHQCTVQ